MPALARICVAGIACSLCLFGARNVTADPQAVGVPTTLLEGNKEILGFAVDGDSYALAYASPVCGPRMHVGRLGKRPVPVSRREPCEYEQLDGIAFADGRVLWSEKTLGNYSAFLGVLTAASTDPQVVKLAEEEAESGDPHEYRLDVRLGSGGLPLVYFDEFEHELSFVRSRRATPSVPLIDFPVAVHVDDGIVTAVTEKVIDGPTMIERLDEVRRRRPPFRTRGVALAVVGSRQRVVTIEASATGGSIVVYDPRTSRILTGAPIIGFRKGAEPRMVISGPWVAFDGGKDSATALVLFDIRNSRVRSVAPAAVGFGLSGGRLVWAEQGPPFRIRATQLR